MGQIKILDAKKFQSRVTDWESEEKPFGSVLWEHLRTANRMLVDADGILSSCGFEGVSSIEYASLSNEIDQLEEDTEKLKEYPLQLVQQFLGVDKKFSEDAKNALNALATIKIDDITITNDFDVRVTQYHDSACEEVPLEHIPTELVPHYSLTLADFVGSFNGPKSQETTYVQGFTDLIYAEFVTDEKDIKTVMDEKSEEIHDMLYGAEFYAKKYQPGKELVSDILGCVSLGAWSIYKACTGYDPITQEYLSPEERKELMQTGTMNAGFFAFGVANMPVMGIKEIAVSYLSIAGGGTSAELTESACEALGLSQEDTRLLSALAGLAVGYTIYSAGSSYLEFYRQNKTAIKAEMAESAPYKAASCLDEMVDDVDDLAVKAQSLKFESPLDEVVDDVDDLAVKAQSLKLESPLDEVVDDVDDLAVKTQSLNLERGESEFAPSKIYYDKQGNLTNGSYTINDSDMLLHKNGTLGKSQFLSDVDAEKAVLDASEYADKYNLWETNTGNPNDFACKAKVYVENGPVGITGDGNLTNYINVYRTKTGLVHGCPGN